mmetsp:Transcript_35300/g.87679  ORF Transcript_35300/g.87679 Transcript_35300/m.87679 type:complete len:250 (-) Transcript_35300:131-880(-)
MRALSSTESSSLTDRSSATSPSFTSPSVWHRSENASSVGTSVDSVVASDVDVKDSELSGTELRDDCRGPASPASRSSEDAPVDDRDRISPRRTIRGPVGRTAPDGGLEGPLSSPGGGPLVGDGTCGMLTRVPPKELSHDRVGEAGCTEPSGWWAPLPPSPPPCVCLAWWAACCCAMVCTSDRRCGVSAAARGEDVLPPGRVEGKTGVKMGMPRLGAAGGAAAALLDGSWALGVVCARGKTGEGVGKVPG